MNGGDSEPEPSGIDVAIADTKLQAQILLLKLGLAALQVTAMIVFLGLHRLLDLFAEWLMPHGSERALVMVQAILAAAFVLISLHLVFDMVVIFVPALRQSPTVRKILEGRGING
jgi:hypothetical protein